jgi:hypothetical protein
MTAPSTFGPRHAARGRFSRRSLWIALASAGGVLALGCLGTVVVGLSAGPPEAKIDAAVWAPTTSPSSPAVSPSFESPSTTPTGLRPSPTTSRPSATRSTAAPASTQICRLSEHGGTFYLYVTSAAAHNFKACAGGVPYVGTIDQLLSSGSGMDRRCILDPEHNAQNDASVAVYSDSMRADLSAARAFCHANGGNGGDGGAE